VTKRLFCAITLLSVMSAGAYAGPVTFSTFVSGSDIGTVEGQQSTIAFTYAGNKFVGSVYFGPNNQQLYQTDLNGLNVQTFGSPLPSPAAGEIVLGTSLGLSGFNSGDIYAGSENAGTIYHYSNGGGAPTVFASGLSGGVKNILFDPGSSFGGNMLVSTSSGNIYTIDSIGTVTLLGSIGAGIIAEGMDIATSNWGPFAGDLVVASETTGSLYLMNTSGTVVATLGGVPIAETVSLVPLNLGLSGNPLEGFYVANYPVDIQKADASQFAGLQGDIIATSEQGSNSQIWDVKYSGNPLNPFSGGATLVGNLPNQSEDGIFVTAQRINLLGTPEPSSMILFGTVLLGVGYSLRRKVTHPTRSN
jgi:hypothetical protein